MNSSTLSIRYADEYDLVLRRQESEDDGQDRASFRCTGRPSFIETFISDLGLTQVGWARYFDLEVCRTSGAYRTRNYTVLCAKTLRRPLPQRLAFETSFEASSVFAHPWITPKNEYSVDWLIEQLRDMNYKYTGELGVNLRLNIFINEAADRIFRRMQIELPRDLA